MNEPHRWVEWFMILNGTILTGLLLALLATGLKAPVD
jgi:hypothetical protein